MSYTKNYESALKLLETLIVTKPKEERAPDVRQMCNVSAMNDYLKRLKLDITPLKMIHVAGTKGKGSTCAMCESVLRNSGLTTGLYTSPHMFDVRERIRLNGVPISKTLFTKHFWECWEQLETTKNEMFPSMATYFRFLTLIAFRIFMEQKVDVAVIEVGVGGRLDATNVITPVVCGITSIGYDHMDLLGDTLAKIASEKAGIMKPNVPCFTYKQEEEAMQVFREKSKQVGAPLYIAPSLADFKSHVNAKFDIGIPGEVQKQNAALALSLCATFLKSPHINIVHKPVLDMIKIDKTEQDVPIAPVFAVPSFFLKGLSKVRWPCRSQIVTFEKQNLLFFIDGAHTVESLTTCCNTFLVHSVSAADQYAKNWKFTPSITKNDYDLLSDDEETTQIDEMVQTVGKIQDESFVQKNLQKNATTRILLFYYTGNRNPEDLIQPLLTEPFDMVILVPSDSQHTVLKNKNITTKDNILIEDKTGIKEKQKLDLVKSLWQSKSKVPVTVADSIQQVLTMIWESSQSSKNQIHVLATGSFYLAGDVLRKLIKMYKLLNLA